MRWAVKAMQWWQAHVGIPVPPRRAEGEQIDRRADELWRELQQYESDMDLEEFDQWNRDVDAPR